ncbi:unnamed protein product [Rhodiola kirilowii]
MMTTMKTKLKKIVKKKMNKKLPQSIASHNIEENNPATPLYPTRMSVQLPFSSEDKPPRSSFLNVGSSGSGLHASQKIRQIKLSQAST